MTPRFRPLSLPPFLALLALLALAPLSEAQQKTGGLPSFKPLVSALAPTVVNVSAEIEVEGDPQSEELREFFRRFFGPRALPPGGQGPRQKQASLGSGFIVDPEGFVLTNNHVVQNASNIRVTFQDGKEREASIVGRDPQTDLALLKVKNEEGQRFQAVQMGDSDSLNEGDWVMAIGNPFGLSHTVTVGIVSAKGRVIGAGPYDDFIQTDASINPGNSGGPLFNLKGELVGINTAIFSRTGGNIGIGFAIPVNLAKGLLPDLRAGEVVRGFLGVSIQPVTKPIARSLDMKEARGALVADIGQGTPAEKQGIRRGDVILSLNGEPVENPRDLSRRVASLKPGSEARLRMFRDGQEREIAVRVGKMPVEEQVAGQPKPQPPREAKAVLGLQVQELTPEIAKQLGTRSDKGVLIVDVKPASPAAEAKLQRGDVIIGANQKPVASVSDLQSALGKSKKEAELLLVDRQGTTFFVTVPQKTG